MNVDTVGQRIRTLREMRGLTQRALAEQAGMHEVSLQYYELGTRNPKPEQLKKLAAALDVDIAFLHPSRTDTPMALYALLFDLIEEYGDIVIENKGGTVLFGIDQWERSQANIKLTAALGAHERLSVEEFKKWLIEYPPKFLQLKS